MPSAFRAILDRRPGGKTTADAEVLDYIESVLDNAAEDEEGLAHVAELMVCIALQHGLFGRDGGVERKARRHLRRFAA